MNLSANTLRNSIEEKHCEIDKKSCQSLGGRDVGLSHFKHCLSHGRKQFLQESRVSLFTSCQLLQDKVVTSKVHPGSVAAVGCNICRPRYGLYSSESFSRVVMENTSVCQDIVFVISG